VYHRLSPPEARIYKEGAAEYRKLKSLLRRLENVSTNVEQDRGGGMDADDVMVVARSHGLGPHPLSQAMTPPREGRRLANTPGSSSFIASNRESNTAGPMSSGAVMTWLHWLRDVEPSHIDG
jgi:hypothetical protein